MLLLFQLGNWVGGRWLCKNCQKCKEPLWHRQLSSLPNCVKNWTCPQSHIGMILFVCFHLWRLMKSSLAKFCSFKVIYATLQYSWCIINTTSPLIKTIKKIWNCIAQNVDWLAFFIFRIGTFVLWEILRIKTLRVALKGQLINQSFGAHIKNCWGCLSGYIAATWNESKRKMEKKTQNKIFHYKRKNVAAHICVFCTHVVKSVSACLIIMQVSINLKYLITVSLFPCWHQHSKHQGFSVFPRKHNMIL